MPLVTDPAILDKLNMATPLPTKPGGVDLSAHRMPDALAPSSLTGAVRGVADLPAHLIPEINKGLDNLGLPKPSKPDGGDFDAGRAAGSEVGMMALGGPAGKALKYAPLAGKHLLEHSLGLGGVRSKLLSWLAKPGARKEILDKLNGATTPKVPETPPVAPTAPAAPVDDGSALLDSLQRQVMERRGQLPRP